MSRDRIIARARAFAIKAHGEQKRKYTFEPYWKHPASVAQRVAKVAPKDSALIAAAFLHDVLEDTPVTFSELLEVFGYEIANLVREVTDVEPHRGNRAARKLMDRERLADASPRAQTLKLADLIDNTESIVQHDPSFAVTYLREKEALLEVLKRGNRTLRKQAAKVLNESLLVLDDTVF
jgi:guanosine-3',5'-bis(diphosphate) 3'-pyrophosphohydrolase